MSIMYVYDVTYMIRVLLIYGIILFSIIDHMHVQFHAQNSLRLTSCLVIGMIVLNFIIIWTMIG